MTIASNRQADHTNRIVLSVIGCLAVLAGAGGLAFSYLSTSATQPLADPSRRDWLLTNGTAAALVGALAIIGLGLLASAWLRYQFRPIEPAGDVTVARKDDGITVLRTAALTDAVEAELGALRGVNAASARIRADVPDRIDVLLDVDDTADLVRIAHEARQQVLLNARRATGRDDLTLAIESRAVAAAAPPRAV